MDALQITSSVAIATLFAITYMLSRKDKIPFFVTVGQDVFKWISVVLATIFVTRLCMILEFINSTQSRSLNSIVFFIAVLGILWSVYRHGKKES